MKKNLSKELALQAKRLGICSEWHNLLKKLSDKREMAEMYIKGIDFCLANDYPDNEYIRANFGEIIHDFGIFLDDRIQLINPERCVALGNTTGSIEVNSYNICEVFVKHHSELTIKAKDNAFVVIDMFDNSVVSISAENRARICINRYLGAEIKERLQLDLSEIKINEKNKKSYING
ncbi:MAG: hypothetical protein LBJ63_07825 [Prevotellaceae bacterium]|jgi:hypothetical protein|nr:hypothetical protein [Prevotellaceae bacterium]